MSPCPPAAPFMCWGPARVEEQQRFDVTMGWASVDKYCNPGGLLVCFSLSSFSGSYCVTLWIFQLYSHENGQGFYFLKNRIHFVFKWMSMFYHRDTNLTQKEVKMKYHTLRAQRLEKVLLPYLFFPKCFWVSYERFQAFLQLLLNFASLFFQATPRGMYKLL